MQAGREAGKQTSHGTRRHDGETARHDERKKEENPTDPDPRTKEGHDLANAVALLVGRFTNPNSN